MGALSPGAVEWPRSIAGAEPPTCSASTQPHPLPHWWLLPPKLAPLLPENVPSKEEKAKWHKKMTGLREMPRQGWEQATSSWHMGPDGAEHTGDNHRPSAQSLLECTMLSTPSSGRRLSQPKTLLKYRQPLLSSQMWQWWNLTLLSPSAGMCLCSWI